MGVTAPTIKSWAWTDAAYDGPATLPTGIATGDLLVAIHMGLWSGGTPTTSNLPSPTDWAKPTAGFSTVTRTYPIAWQVHYQRAISSSPTARTFTVTNPSGGSLYYDTVLIVCLDGAISTGDPIEALSAASAANPLALAGITPAADDRLALLAATNTGGTSPGLPAGFTSITTQADGTTLSWRFASIEDDAAGTEIQAAQSDFWWHARNVVGPN